MPGFSQLYEQNFELTDTIVVTHNLNRLQTAVRVICDGICKNEYIRCIDISQDNPRNEFTVLLDQPLEGKVVIIDSNYVFSNIGTPEESAALTANTDGADFSTVFGRKSFFQQESAETFVTQSSEWQTKVLLDAGVVPSGTYRLGWQYNWDYGANADSLEVRVLSDSSVVNGGTSDPLQTSIRAVGEEYSPRTRHSSGFSYVTFSESSPRTFQLQFKSPNGSDAKCWNAFIELWRVG